jgi:hypothetical protein
VRATNLLISSVMADSESTREGGRGRGRGQAPRRSHRDQGLPPEETKSLDEVAKEARQVSAVKRKAANERKQRPSQDTQDQPDSEPPVQDAHHASPDGVAEPGSNVKASGDHAEDSSSDSRVAFMGVSGSDAPTQASVGDAVKKESSAEGGASEPPRPSQDVQEEIVIWDDDLEQEEKPAPQLSVPAEAPSIKSEGPLSTVKGEVAPRMRLRPDARRSSRRRLKSPCRPVERVHSGLRRRRHPEWMST